MSSDDFVNLVAHLSADQPVVMSWNEGGGGMMKSFAEGLQKKWM